MDIGAPQKRTRTYPLTQPVPDDQREPKIAPPTKEPAAPTKAPEKVTP